MNKSIKLYNLILPIWLIIWWPSPLWLVLIPINYLIDTFVLYFLMKKTNVESYKERTFKLSWKICIAGFLADFVGSLFLFILEEISGQFKIDWVISGTMNPFSSIGGFLLTCIAVFIAGFCIYQFDKWVLKRTHYLDNNKVHLIAAWMAIITSPYFFFIPYYFFNRGL